MTKPLPRPRNGAALPAAALLFFLVLPAAAPARAQEAKVVREPTEWCDVWMPHTGRTDLPRVLLIGDSITRAYYPDVEKDLAGKAWCARIATSKSVGDPALIAELTVFLQEGNFDVIHFNNGMHGWGYSEQDYRRHFLDLLATLRRCAPHARLIWASTTPVRRDHPPGPTNARIAARNAIALKFATAAGIPVDDQFALMQTHQDLHKDDVHYVPQGAAIQAEQVARTILAQLPAGK
jgi:hypothetical protein